MAEPLRIDVWSDIICPWCAIGRVRLRKAIDASGVAAKVVHRAFELDPLRKGTVPTHVYLAERYGSEADVTAMTQRVRELAAAEGLTLRTEEALATNTFDAHRILLWAQDNGKGEDAMDHLVRAHFEDILDVSDREVLVGIAKGLGLDPNEAQRVLESGQYAAEVRADEETAGILGVNGVPFFVFADRYGISGAQPQEAFAKAIRMALAPAA